MSDGVIVVLTGAACAIACAIPGCFLVLRGISLIGDAISHAVETMVTKGKRPMRISENCARKRMTMAQRKAPQALPIRSENQFCAAQRQRSSRRAAKLPSDCSRPAVVRL